MAMCDICSAELPYSRKCPNCYPIYQRDIATGHIWPTLKEAGVTPTYQDWVGIRAVEISGAVKKSRMQASIQQASREEFKKELLRRQEELNKKVQASIDFEVNRVLKLHTVKRPTPEEQARKNQEFFDSTYSF